MLYYVERGIACILVLNVVFKQSSSLDVFRINIHLKMGFYFSYVTLDIDILLQKLLPHKLSIHDFFFY